MKSKLLFWGFLSLLVVACTKNKISGERELNLVSEMKVSGYDPALGGDMYTSAEMGKVFEGLFEFHPIKRPYELLPVLSDGMPEVSADGLTYTFKLVKGVKFRDDACFKEGKGRELVAQDIIYSIKRLADAKIASRGWWLFDDKIEGLNDWRLKYASADKTNYDEEVSGLKAIDSHTLQVKLTKAYPQFLYALAMPFSFIVAQEAVTHYGKEFLNHPVGTGPFILPKFEQSGKIIYTKNPHYRERFYPDGTNSHRVPVADKITVHVITESQPRWLNFQKGGLDVIGIPKDYIEKVIKNGELIKEFSDKGMKLVYRPMLDVTFYAFNHSDPLFKNNLKLRQAMSMAYDRAEVNKLFYANTALQSHGVIPPGMSGYNKDFKNPYVEYNVEAAKKLLAEAGYPGGKGLPPLTLQTINTTENRQSAEFFAKCMAAIGITINVSMNTWPELVNKVSKKNHQLYTMAWSADYPDAENFLGLLYCPNQAPGSNGANYCNPKFDELYQKATTMQDSPERTKLYEEINQMVSKDVPWIFGVHRTKFFIHQGWLKNYQFMEFNHSQYQYMGVDLDAKKEMIKKL